MREDISFEAMPRPANAKDFASWLVPARNNIQRQLYRLRLLFNRHAGGTAQQMVPLNRLAGIGFSLWRAVFQASHPIGTEKNVEDARYFLDQIILNNAATYATEHNAWSLGYYLGNARLRIIPLEAMLSEVRDSEELQLYIQGVRDIVNQKPHTTEDRSASEEWEMCFHCMRLMLDILDGRQS